MSGSSPRFLQCAGQERRTAIRQHDSLHGIDYIEVTENQQVLEVHFIAKETAAGRQSRTDLLEALADDTEAVTIEGGERISDIDIEAVEHVEDHVRVTVDRSGDFSTYVLRLRTPSDPNGGSFELDPVFSTCTFSFKAGCPSRFDCKPREDRFPEERETPAIDYMAKDYASFRQALLDLAPQLVPGWDEHREADVGTMLIELLSHVGDELSYFQDAVGNEAYLETARQRTSVRRHARLIDYPMHDGLSARTFVHVTLTEGAGGIFPSGTQIVSTIDERLRQTSPPHGPVIEQSLGSHARSAAAVVFEAFGYRALHEDSAGVPLHAALNEIVVHAWENDECCLPSGTTSADLRGDLAFDPSVHDPENGEGWRLKPGDVLLFEEIRDPETGRRADANPEHRQVVRLVDVETLEDPVADQTLTRVHWHPDDALDFPLCVRTEEYEVVSVARGNLIPADHGETVASPQWHPVDPAANPDSPGIEVGDRPYRFKLQEGPLSYRLPVGEDASVRELHDVSREKIRQSNPQVWLRSHPVEESVRWEPVSSLLDGSDAFDPHFVPETDNDGRAVIRFGNDEFGLSPPDGAHFRPRYRVGVGRSGNVGADALRHVISDGKAEIFSAIESVRNPVPAWGGTDPESMETVKEVAPEAFHAQQYRAVTEEDYSRIAGQHPELSRAVATFRWTGSWHTVFISIDPVGQTAFDRSLAERVRTWVKRYTQAGYDLEISPPTYVPLEIRLEVCVAPDYFRAHVREALRDVLTSRLRPDGEPGFFHPDRFTFGQSLYESQLYSTVEGVPGVDSVQIVRFERLHREAAGEREQGYIPAGRLEILRLDNDPNFPENGVLELNMRGGK